MEIFSYMKKISVDKSYRVIWIYNFQVSTYIYLVPLFVINSVFKFKP